MVDGAVAACGLDGVLRQAVGPAAALLPERGLAAGLGLVVQFPGGGAVRGAAGHQGGRGQGQGGGDDPVHDPDPLQRLMAGAIHAPPFAFTPLSDPVPYTNPPAHRN